MRIWGPRTRVCHFCGESSVLAPPYGARSIQISGAQRVSAGTPHRWFCSACESWNLVGKHGEILDAWDRSMWDESVNRAPLPRTSAQAHQSPFCNTCLMNQTLVANMLAEYLPDENDAHYAEREQSLDAYRHSLEQRYPIVCDRCLPHIENHIAAVDARVQHQLLGAWLNRNAELRTNAADTQAALFLAEIHAWRWRRIIWLASTVAGGGMSVALAAGFRTMPLHVCAAISCVPIRWDPLQRALAGHAARGTPAVAHGTRTWRYAQFALWLMRIILVAAWCRNVSISWTAAVVVLCVYTFVIVGACLCVSVTVDKVHTRKARTSSAPAPTAGPLAQLSLVSEAPLAEPVDALIERHPTEDMEVDEVEPELKRSSRDIVLGPQRFWAPEPSSGLEDLFGHVLHIDPPHERMQQPRTSPFGAYAWPAMLAAGATIVVAGAAVTVALAAGATAVLTTQRTLSVNLLGGLSRTLR